MIQDSNIFRKAGPADYEQVRSFYHLVTDYSNAQPYGPCWEKDIHPSCALLKSSLENGQLYLMEQSGIIIAAMVLNHSTHHAYDGIAFQGGSKPEEVYILHLLCVHPEHLHRGHAKAMLSEAIRIARDDGMRSVWLDVLHNNESAVKLYKSCGFRLVARIPGMYDVFIGPTDGELYEYPIS